MGDWLDRSDVEERAVRSGGMAALPVLPSSEYELESDAWRAISGFVAGKALAESEAERAWACSVRWMEVTSDGSRAGIELGLNLKLSPLLRVCLSWSATSDGITSALSAPTPTMASRLCVDPRGDRGDVRRDPLRLGLLDDE